MDFVLALHSHLPYVLHHGRWPHGSDWLCEAALDSYLPLLEQLQALAAYDTPAPLTIRFTPVLATLLARDESIRLQLAVGRREHGRLFGRDPVGCWLPECAYRPRAGTRPGIEEHLAAAGFRYFFTDAHLAQAGEPLGTYAEVPLGAERFDVERADTPAGTAARPVRSAYRAYRVTPPRAKPSVAALVRDPRSSMQVWSRHRGYPGDEWYLEFHKIRWPGGLKLWRGTGPPAALRAHRPPGAAPAPGRRPQH